ncbi:MAG: hypothetical protein M3P40_00190 [Actinomycetota bacterium]|nr:hypothetical protein [Actinomycetota bacterium]
MSSILLIFDLITVDIRPLMPATGFVSLEVGWESGNLPAHEPTDADFRIPATL